MKLSVNLIGQGRYWLAGTEIAEEDVPVHLRRYAVTDDDGDASREEEKAPSPAPAKRKRSRWGARKPSSVKQ